MELMMRKEGWVLVALLGFAVGCPPTRAQLSAGFTGCEPQEVVVTPHQYGSGWIATCRGRRFYCITFGQGGVSCSPVSGPGIVNPHAPAPPATPPPGRVDRVLVASGSERVPMIRGDLMLGSYRIELHFTPSRGDNVLWRVTGPRALVRPSCPPIILADGAVVPLLTPSYATEGDTGSYRFTTTLEVARQLAHAQRVSGRMCENEFRWDQGERAFFEELSARFDEELAWLHASHTTSGGEATP